MRRQAIDSGLSIRRSPIRRLAMDGPQVPSHSQGENLMGKFLLVYQGGSGMAASAEEQARVMAAWNDWFGRLGPALVDGGSPTAAVKRIAPGGAVTDEPSGPTGYSIIKADSLGQAVELAKGSPLLQAGGTIQVAETVEM
jgi:hypothetical protein